MSRENGRPVWSVLSLIGIAAIWGATFPLVRDGIAGVPTLSFLELRFLFAAMVLVPLAGYHAGFRAILHPRALAPGLFLTLGYLFQTEGLRTVSPSVSAFLTSASVVFVPAFGWLLRWEPTDRRRASAAVLAILGIFLLNGARLPGRWSAGESWTVLCAVSFALQILSVGRAMRTGAGALALTAGQVFYATLLFFVAGAARGEGPIIALGRGSLFAALFTGLLATALAFLVQSRAQRDLHAGTVAILFSTEPLFAALVSIAFYGDRLLPLAILGAIAVTAAALLAGLEPRRIVQPGFSRSNEGAG